MFEIFGQSRKIAQKQILRKYLWFYSICDFFVTCLCIRAYGTVLMALKYTFTAGTHVLLSEAGRLT